MKIKLLLPLLLLVLVTGSLYSQSRRTADKYFDKFAFVKSAELYKAVYRKGDSSKHVLSRLGDSYYNNSKTKEAAYWYKKLVETNNDIEPDYLFKYAHCLRGNGDYQRSDSIFSVLASKEEFSEKFKKELKREGYLLDYTNKRDKRIGIRNLAINTAYSDFGGFMFNQKVYFASTSPPKGIEKNELYKWNEQPYLNIYEADALVIPLEGSAKDTIFVLEDKKQLASELINTKYHESSPAITKDGKTMYFTRVNFNGKRLKKAKENTVNLKLFKTKLVNGVWDKPVELPFCSEEYSTGHPALSPDEKELYFTSDMPGGYGESDLYKVAIIGDDDYGEPVNLGAGVNTLGKEMFPFVSEDSTLYFSSNGHLGVGLLDIFQTKIKGNNTYSEVENLGYPFNSKRDDFAFSIDAAGKKGLFSSNRSGGKGDDDMYSFIIYTDVPKPICEQTIQGIVRDSKEKKPVPYATVKLINSDRQVIEEVLSGLDGSYSFKKVPCGIATYTLYGDKLDYKPDSKTATSTNKNGEVIKVDLELTPLIVGDQIVINPIYFDFDKSDIRDDAKYELEFVVTVMNNNPDMVIKIESHTDSRGSARYNRLLSDRRAKSTRNYIISRGIARHRIKSAIGYGESQLLNHCDDRNAKRCSDEEHQLNRRSYFYIVSGGKNVNVGNKKPSVIDRGYKTKNHIKRKHSSKNRLLELLNNHKKDRAKKDENTKCKKEESCE